MPQRQSTRLIAGCALGVTFFLLYLWIPRDWDAISGSDGYFFADVGENVEGLRGFVFGRPLHRHLLFSAIGHPLYLIGKAVVPAGALAFPTAVLGALGVVALFAITCRLATGWASQAVLSALYGVSAAQVTYAGVPETYVPAATLLLISLLAWCHEPRPQRRPWQAVLCGSLVLLGLMNPVLLAMLCIALVIDGCRRPDGGARVLRTILLCLVAGIIVQVIRGFVLTASMPRTTWWGTLGGSWRYLSGYGQLSRFASPQSVVTVLLNTFVFSIGALPVASFDDAAVASMHSQGVRSLWAYCQSIPGTVFLITSAVCAAAIVARGRAQRRLAWTLWPYLLCHTAFFVWFNPREAFLYSPAAIGPFFVVVFGASLALRARVRLAFLGLALLVCAANNLVVRLSPYPSRVQASMHAYQTFDGGKNEKSSESR